jgi:hypothetical protein
MVLKRKANGKSGLKFNDSLANLVNDHDLVGVQSLESTNGRGTTGSVSIKTN